MENGELVQAELFFRDILKSRANFAPALTGLAEIAFQKTELNEAVRLVESAIGTKQDWIPAHILRSRIYALNEDYDFALEQLQIAERLNTSNKEKSLNGEIFMRLADAYFGVGNLIKAQKYYELAFENNPHDNLREQKLVELEEYSTLTRNRNSRISKIIVKQNTSRADVSVLFSEFLLPLPYSPNGPGYSIEDLPSDSLLRAAILECTNRGFLPVLPDNTFRPADRVDRIEMALFIENVLKAKFENLSTIRHFQFNDVPSFQPYSKAADLVNALNLIIADEYGWFFPRKQLSGFEAVRIVDKLAGILKFSVFPEHLLWNESPHTE